MMKSSTMGDMNSPNSTANNIIIYTATIIVSSLLSAYSLYAADVINNDGILYIYTAEAFLEGGISKAMTVFSWPFFPITIAWLHSLTGIGIETSAFAVNAILLMLLSIAFIRIYEEISTPHLPLWVPAIFILALPIINDYRAYVIRGHGFWAFTLIALYFFIRYSKQASIRYALLWQISAIIATLFRIEGVVFLAFAPLFFVFEKKYRQGFIRHFLRLNSITIPATIAGVIVLFSYIIKIDGLSNGLLQRLSYMLPSSMITALSDTASEIKALMPLLSSVESVILLISGLIALICFKVAKNLNLLYLAIWLFGRKKQWIQLSKESSIVLFFAFISTLPLIIIASNHFFMSSRYTVLTVILFSLVSFQYLEHLLHKLAINKKYLATTVLSILMVVFFLDAIMHTGSNKQNMITASNWVSLNIDTNAKIACDNSRFAYYTKQQCAYERRLNKKPIKYTAQLINVDSYNHLLFWLDHNDKKLRSYLDSNKSLSLLQAFKNHKGDEARVYKIQKNIKSK